MKQYVYEVLQEASSKKSKTDKVKVLKQNESWALKDILRGTLDSTVKWNLPQGEPPYTKSDGHNHATNLHRQNTQFKYFTKNGPGSKMPAVKREKIFIGLIEGVHPEDARLVINMVNKTPIEGISKNIVKEAFPGLLKD